MRPYGRRSAVRVIVHHLGLSQEDHINKSSKTGEKNLMGLASSLRRGTTKIMHCLDCKMMLGDVFLFHSVP